jgi:hypothetical protein
MPFNPGALAAFRRYSDEARLSIEARADARREQHTAAAIAASETTAVAFACGVANARHGGDRGD